jgi:heme exporter protein B
MAFARLVFVIMAKDLRAELRTKEAVNASLAFAVVILVLFNFAFDIDEPTTREIVGGLLWLVFAFAGTLIFNRSFARELPNDCLDALVAAPISGAALFLGKGLASYVLVLAVELVSLPVFGIFYNVWFQFGQILIVLALGTWGVTVIGTMFSALTYPMLVPALMGSMVLTASMATGTPLWGQGTWLKLLIGFDVLYTAAAVALVEVILVG